MHVDPTVALPCNGAGDVVTDAEGAMPLALAFPERGQGVRGLPALAEDKDERILGHGEIAVTEFTGILALGGDLG